MCVCVYVDVNEKQRYKDIYYMHKLVIYTCKSYTHTPTHTHTYV